MTWGDQTGTLLLALVVVLVPGAAAALTIRLRGYDVLAAAAPLSIAMLAAASLVNVVVPFRWSVGAWAVCSVLLIGVAFALRVAVDRFADSRRVAVAAAASSGRPRDALVFVITGVVVVIGALRLMSAFGAPSNISQTFDNIYHLNAVRQILDDGLIAPTRQLLPGFYPDLWHVVVSTVAQMSGEGVAASVNAASVVIGAVVWPISCIWLVRTLVGRHVAASAAAGALSIGMAAFPLLMLDFGVLYPNVLSIALLPSAIAAIVLVAGIGRGARPDPVVRWTLLVALVPTVALAHPSTMMAFFLPASLIGFAGTVRWWRTQRLRGGADRTRRVALLALVGALAAAVVLFIVARPNPVLAFWPPSATVPEALGHVVSAGFVWRPASWIVSIFAVMGALTVVIVRRWRHQWWLVVSTAMMLLLYVLCLTLPMGWLRYGITGTWYQDVYRIAALMPTFLVPLGALGVVGLIALCTRVLRAESHSTGSGAAQAVGVVAGLAILAVTQSGAALAEETESTATMYRQDAWSPLLTDDERALIERLADTVPEDDVIVGNPWTGTSLSFALGDRRALVPHIFQELTSDMVVITERLHAADEDAEVCAALERTGTAWVLDFGSAEIHNGDHSYPGLDDLGDVVRLADSEGAARLFEIVACR